MLLPSSHPSAPALIPSPQVVEQIDLELTGISRYVQVNPGRAYWQVSSHPNYFIDSKSLGSVTKGSHFSVPSKRPFPHISGILRYDYSASLQITGSGGDDNKAPLNES